MASAPTGNSHGISAPVTASGCSGGFGGGTSRGGFEPQARNTCPASGPVASVKMPARPAVNAVSAYTGAAGAFRRADDAAVTAPPALGAGFGVPHDGGAGVGAGGVGVGTGGVGVGAGGVGVGAGVSGVLVFAGSGGVTVPPPGGVPSLVAEFSTCPASMSAWVIA